MVRVLVIGATGYVGQAVALSLVRSGNHVVYGLARSEAKARNLAQQEIMPVICPDLVADPSSMLKAIESERISVVIACGADQEAAKVLEATVTAGKQRLSTLQAAGQVFAPKLGFIYTSGSWVHGSSVEQVSDLDPVGVDSSLNPPAKLVAWRPALEQEILRQKEILDVAIVRPALVYGYNGGLLKPFLQPIIDAVKSGGSKADVYLNACYPGTVHIDDVAHGFQLVVEKLPLLAGTGVLPTFDLGAQIENMQDIINAFARHAGYSGQTSLVGAGDNVFAQAMSTSTNGDSGRAKTLLGWQPKRASLLAGMNVYAKALLA